MSETSLVSHCLTFVYFFYLDLCAFINVTLRTNTVTFTFYDCLWQNLFPVKIMREKVFIFEEAWYLRSGNIDLLYIYSPFNYTVHHLKRLAQKCHKKMSCYGVVVGRIDICSY